MSTACKVPSPTDVQFKLFEGVPTSTHVTLLRTAVDSERRFVTGDARSIFLGTTRLDSYL